MRNPGIHALLDNARHDATTAHPVPSEFATSHPAHRHRTHPQHRQPRRQPLGEDAAVLEHLGLQPDPHGFLTVDDTLRTGTENIWAIGDLRGGPMFTHTARDDADIVYCTDYRDQDRTAADRIVPHAVFTDPEVVSVGLTEPAARAAGYDVVIGRQDFTGVAKAAPSATPAAWSNSSPTPPPTASSAATSPDPTPATSSTKPSSP